MRVFVTGANGQVGREVARVLNREPLYLATHATDDVSDKRIVETIVRERPDLVIHAAAMTDVDACEREPDAAYRVNEEGTRLVARGAAQAGAALVAISTDYVFDGTKGAPYVESDQPNPINVYGHSKLAGEQAALRETDRVCVVRTAWVFGLGKNHFISMVVNRVRQGEPIRAVIDKYGSPTSAKDLVGAILRLAERKATGIYHAAGTGSCNWLEYAEQILKSAGCLHPLEPITFADLHRPAMRPSNTALASERLSAQGISMRGWREMVDEYVLLHESTVRSQMIT
ncbi:MAG: dTDP-4-dehydrorhamnose reductase [Nitrospiraceae bacterium]